MLNKAYINYNESESEESDYSDDCSSRNSNVAEDDSRSGSDYK